MTKLESLLKRMRNLPPERQEAMAVQIDMLLDDEERGEGSLLTDEQWADVEAALADTAEPVSSHQEVFARLRMPAAE
jgi:hypothetical protein